eukprot:1153453-Pelagomonas_calceolata.AAC.1
MSLSQANECSWQTTCAHRRQRQRPQMGAKSLTRPRIPACTLPPATSPDPDTFQPEHLHSYNTSILFSGQQKIQSIPVGVFLLCFNGSGKNMLAFILKKEPGVAAAVATLVPSAPSTDAVPYTLFAAAASPLIAAIPLPVANPSF